MREWLTDYLFIRPTSGILEKPSVRGLLGAAAVALSLFVMFAVVVLLFRFAVALINIAPLDKSNNGQSIRNLGLVFVALVSLPFLVWRSAVADRQASVSEQTLFNSKVASATDKLSSRVQVSHRKVHDGKDVIIDEWTENLVDRVAAIDQLETLARERPSESYRIVKLIAAYVRGNFPAHSLAAKPDLVMRATPRIDLQAAVDTIGRLLPVAYEAHAQNWRLNLRKCNLDGVVFSNGYYRATDFTQSRFEGAILNRANFEGCLFFGCLMNYVQAFNANLRGARLDHIILNEPRPIPGGMTESINFADLEGATFIGADLRALDYIGEPEVISATFGTNDTLLDNQITRDKPSVSDHRRAFGLSRKMEKGEILTAEQEGVVKNVASTGFLSWPPYQSNDGAIGWALTKFKERLNQDTWPFHDRR